ncbi:MAG: peptide-methionine (R)-S-oxide reductase MsrB [Dokdonella sp.]
MNTPDDTNAFNPDRRRLLLGGSALVVTLGFISLRKWMPRADAETLEHFEVTHTDAEWKARLAPNRYAILRQQGTEPAFSSPLDHEKHDGIFACAGCDLGLFSSRTKFDSGTGWPSFWKPLANAVKETRDSTLGMARTEIHCRRCGGHLGHVFNDGPAPTGLRYCMNGLALVFKAAA